MYFFRRRSPRGVRIGGVCNVIFPGSKIPPPLYLRLAHKSASRRLSLFRRIVFLRSDSRYVGRSFFPMDSAFPLSLSERNFSTQDPSSLTKLHRRIYFGLMRRHKPKNPTLKPWISFEVLSRPQATVEEVTCPFISPPPTQFRFFAPFTNQFPRENRSERRNEFPLIPSSISPRKTTFLLFSSLPYVPAIS